MSPKTKLKSCLEELSMVNQAYAAMSAGTKDTREERKAKAGALMKRKSVLKEKLMLCIDEYVKSVNKEKQ